MFLLPFDSNALSPEKTFKSLTVLYRPKLHFFSLGNRFPQLRHSRYRMIYAQLRSPGLEVILKGKVCLCCGMPSAETQRELFSQRENVLGGFYFA